jgi:hypothetical protein
LVTAPGRISASAIRFTAPVVVVVKPRTVPAGVVTFAAALKTLAVSPCAPLSCPRITVAALAVRVKLLEAVA